MKKNREAANFGAAARPQYHVQEHKTSWALCGHHSITTAKGQESIPHHWRCASVIALPQHQS
ncbi:hypothetical protein Syun_004185 [Stephania yunnanensis]|uniref:Uncharacterized protein n=1 Tax=Stephania yunnanensis TaxID=152371 RepID=A0AAP0Q0Y6_9MAGN